jgi:site-specific DNA-methyltransferase (adenine-specific)
MIKRNHVYPGDVLEVLRGLPDDIFHLIVTSPPYNVEKDYGNGDTDNLSVVEYREFTRKWITECHRVLVTGGRIAINVGNTGRKPYKYLSDLIVSILEELGMLARQEFIWYKGHAVAAGKTAWGSYCDAMNPITRDCHEYIEVFSKDDYRLDCDGFPDPDITKTEFALCSFSVWEIKPAHGLRWHPAPFPEEIPYRLMKFYTRPGMLVLDPFMGSGTTAAVANSIGREWVGIEKNPEFIKRAMVRLKSGMQRARMFDKVERMVENGKQETLF